MSSPKRVKTPPVQSDLPQEIMEEITKRVSPSALPSLGLTSKGMSVVVGKDLEERAKRMKVSANFHKSLVLNDQGKVYQFGTVGIRNLSSPTLVKLHKMVNISSGRPNLAIDELGDVFTWITSVKQFSTLKEIVEIECSKGLLYISYFAIDSKGKIFSLGDNSSGQLGLGDNQDRNSWDFIPSKTKFVSVSAGFNHTLALSDKGEVYSWGDSEQGKLGRKNKNTNIPGKVKIPTKVVAISAGQSHSLALDENGDIYSWGFNNYGELGLGWKDDDYNTFVSKPELVECPVKFKAISAGQANSVALDINGYLYGWGDNLNGNLGVGTLPYRLIPTQSSSTIKFVSISNGGSHCLAVSEKAQVYAWGDNKNGQLGLGNKTSKNKPTRVIL